MRALRVLCEVDAQGSFTAAAEALGLSQSAVSQHISALERQAGAGLVERGVRPVALTAAGHMLAGHGRAIMTRLDTAEQELAEVVGRRQRRLRLGTFPTALTTFAPMAISLFRKQNADVALTVVDDHLQRLLTRLHDRELDLAVVYDHESFAPATDLGLTSVPLLDDRFVVVLARGHRLSRRSAPLGLVELASDPWIGGSSADSAWFRIVRHACREAGFEPKVAVGSDDYQAVQAFAAAGLGVAVVPGLAAAMPAPGVVVKPLRATPATRRISVVRPSEGSALTAATSMISALTVAARRYRIPGAPVRVARGPGSRRR